MPIFHVFLDISSDYFPCFPSPNPLRPRYDACSLFTMLVACRSRSSLYGPLPSQQHKRCSAQTWVPPALADHQTLQIAALPGRYSYQRLVCHSKADSLETNHARNGGKIYRKPYNWWLTQGFLEISPSTILSITATFAEGGKSSRYST